MLFRSAAALRRSGLAGLPSDVGRARGFDATRLDLGKECRRRTEAAEEKEDGRAEHRVRKSIGEGRAWTMRGERTFGEVAFLRDRPIPGQANSPRGHLDMAPSRG